MYRLPSCAEHIPPTWLAPGLDQGPSSLLPRGTSFGRSVQPSPTYFKRGRRSDLSARGRVPPIPEVPGRVLTPNSFKRLHIHAVPSSSMPARPSLGTSPDDPRALLRAACLVSECGHVLTHCAGFLFRPKGCSIHSLDRKPCLSTQHHHVGGHSCARLWRRPVAHQDQWHELVPLLLRLSARRLQTPAQRPKAPFYEPVAPGLLGRSPSLVYPKQTAHLQYYLGPEIRALVTMQLSESSVPSYNFEYQFSSDGRGLLVREREALEPF